MARNKLPQLAGWTRIKGSARRYKDPSGNIVSRRKYEDARYKQVGWDSWHDYQKIKKSDEWLRLEGIYVEKKELKGRRQVGPTSAFASKYLALRHARRSHAPDLHDPDGPLNDWLVEVGVKVDGAAWDITSDPSVTAQK